MILFSLTDGFPPPLAQRRMSTGERGGEGKGGTEGTYVCMSIYYIPCVRGDHGDVFIPVIPLVLVHSVNAVTLQYGHVCTLTLMSPCFLVARSSGKSLSKLASFMVLCGRLLEGELAIHMCPAQLVDCNEVWLYMLLMKNDTLFCSEGQFLLYSMLL